MHKVFIAVQIPVGHILQKGETIQEQGDTHAAVHCSPVKIAEQTIRIFASTLRKAATACVAWLPGRPRALTDQGIFGRQGFHHFLR